MAQISLASRSFLKEEYLNTLILWTLKWTFFSFPQVFFKEASLQVSSFTLPWISGAGGFTYGVYSTLDKDCKLQGVRQFSLPAVPCNLSIVDFTSGWFFPSSLFQVTLCFSICMWLIWAQGSLSDSLTQGKVWLFSFFLVKLLSQRFTFC